jgi:8-oxo-dGTP pyrophosphatase MutT (NUDIX family)
MVEPKPYRRLSRRLACQNTMFEVYFDEIETPAGAIVPDFLIVKPKVAAAGSQVVGVCVLPRIAGRLGLMRGYRHQFDTEVWQAPAGFVDAGESAAEAALRELKEETGLTCPPERLRPLGAFMPDAGLLEGSIALFLADLPDHQATRPSGPPEVGVAPLTWFEPAALRALVLATPEIGGSTLVACLRFLATQDPPPP